MQNGSKKLKEEAKMATKILKPLDNRGDKCNTCSHKNNCVCRGAPTFDNFITTQVGQMMVPVRCDEHPKQERGPYNLIG